MKPPAPAPPGRWTVALVAAAATALVAAPSALQGQWQNRYPHVSGYGHHVYLEGYELPILNSGPLDPAPAPDGRRLAFAARGWIWILDLRTGAARQLTRGRDVDSRPAWHPSGDRIAIVRDNDRDTRIVIVDAASGDDLVTIDTPAIDLDPAYSADGGTLYYTSGQAGTLDIWARDMTTGDARPVTSDPGIELKPQPLPDGRLMLVAKRGGDRVEVRGAAGSGAAPGVPSRTGSPAGTPTGPLLGSQPRVLVAGSIASMARPALAPDGRTLALNWPTQEGWELRIHDVDSPGPSVLLTGSTGGGLPLTPAWSHDGEWVYYSEPDEGEVMRLKRIRAAGGSPREVEIRAWEWAQPTARLRIRTVVATAGAARDADGAPQGSSGQMGQVDGRGDAAPDGPPAPARLNVLGPSGHPAIPDAGSVHSEGASGRVFFYSPGVIELAMPAGEATVSAVQGLATPEVTRTVSLAPGSVTEVTLALEPVWDARAAGWASGDHHFHLNYGGQTRLSPGDMVLPMQGEALDVATPLLANLHNRYEDQHMWGWEKSDASPLIRFGQEIRSHFLGHMGLVETRSLYWPWVWGPGYEVYGADDRANAEVLEFAHAQGGLGYYVHPVSVPDPFAAGGGVPVELIADAVTGHVDALEVVCLWSSFEGTAALWHRFLNLGLTVAPSAGTDVMLNLHRTMAVGVTRIYVHTGEHLNWPAYIEGLRLGRSFVTNGPLLDFRVGDRMPGEVLAGDDAGRGAAGGEVSWSLDLATATAVDAVEILVNGRVVASHPGISSPGRRSYSGRIETPAGGWIAARARGGETRWPSMDTEPFAHTGPVWIGARGSTDPAARRQAATELLTLLDASHARLRLGYDGVSIPRLEERFALARERLEALRD